MRFEAGPASHSDKFIHSQRTFPSLPSHQLVRMDVHSSAMSLADTLGSSHIAYVSSMYSAPVEMLRSFVVLCPPGLLTSRSLSSPPREGMTS